MRGRCWGETINLQEVDKEESEGYKSCDDNNNGSMLNENNDYILSGLHWIVLLGIEIIIWHYSAFQPLPFGYIVIQPYT